MGPTFRIRTFAPDFRARVVRSGPMGRCVCPFRRKVCGLTSKHHEGFALWPSKEASATWGRPWNAVETGPKRDLLGDLTDAVRSKGLRMGYLLFALRVVQPALAHRQAALHPASTCFRSSRIVVTRYKPAIIFSDGEWELTSARMAQPRAAGVAVQRITGQRRRRDQRPLGQVIRATNTAATGLRNIRPA